MSTNAEKHSWFTSLLTGWGVKESWAKIIAGAIIGALAAAGILTTESCTATVSQTHPDGSSTCGTVTIILPEQGK